MEWKLSKYIIYMQETIHYIYAGNYTSYICRKLYTIYICGKPYIIYMQETIQFICVGNYTLYVCRKLSKNETFQVKKRGCTQNTMNFTKCKSQYVFLKLNFKFFLAFFEFIFKFAEFSKSINFLFFFIACVHKQMPIKPEDTLQEPILSFHHMGPGTELRLSSLLMRAFTH